MSNNLYFKQLHIKFNELKNQFSNNIISEYVYIQNLNKLASTIRTRVTPVYEKGMFNPIGEGYTLLSDINSEINKLRTQPTFN